MAHPPRTRGSGGADRGGSGGDGCSAGGSGSGSGCGGGGGVCGGGDERGGGSAGGRGGRGRGRNAPAFVAAPPSACVRAVPSPLRRRPAVLTVGATRTGGDAAALPAGGWAGGGARAAVRRLRGGGGVVGRVWSPKLPPSLPLLVPPPRTGGPRMGALDALKGAPRWMLSQPEPSPVVRKPAVLPNSFQLCCAMFLGVAAPRSLVSSRDCSSVADSFRFGCLFALFEFADSVHP